MRHVFFLFSIILVSMSVQAAQTKQIQVQGQTAVDLMQALIFSGVEMVEAPDGSGFQTLSPAKISCQVVREHTYSAGMFNSAPSCYQVAPKNGEVVFDFDKELGNAAKLMTALETAGADADGGHGKYLISTEQVSCKYTFEPQTTNCSLEVLYKPSLILSEVNVGADYCDNEGVTCLYHDGLYSIFADQNSTPPATTEDLSEGGCKEQGVMCLYAGGKWVALDNQGWTVEGQ